MTFLVLATLFSMVAMIMGGYRLLLGRVIFGSCDPFAKWEMLNKFAIFFCLVTYVLLQAAHAAQANPYDRYTDLTGRSCVASPMVCRPVPDGDVGFSGSSGFIWFGHVVPASAITLWSPDRHYHVCSKGDDVRCLIVPHP